MEKRKIDEELEHPTCTKGKICTCLSMAITSVNGRANGLNVFHMRNFKTGKVRNKYGLMFDKKAKGDEVGCLLLSFCPFCGIPFDDGIPQGKENINESVAEDKIDDGS